MEGSNNRGDDSSSSSRRGSNDSSSKSKKGTKRGKTLRVASFPQPLPPEVAAQYLSAAAVAWEKNSSSSNQKDKKPFGPSRPPASVSFGSLDLAALAQSGSLDFAAAAAAANRSSSSSSGENATPPCSEAEMKALMSMFVEIMGMSVDPDNKNKKSSGSNSSASQKMSQAAQNFLASSKSGSSSSSGSSSFPVFMFGNSSRDMPTPPGGWTTSTAAAAAAAAGMRISHDGSPSWGVDYCDEEETDDDDSIPDLDEIGGKSSPKETPTKSKDSSERDDAGFSPAALAALEQAEADDALQEEERARKAAKKREKKQRKKEKAKKEAALKASQAAQKKREKLVLSWRSRVVSACQSNEVSKLESLLSESPLRPPKTTLDGSEQQQQQDGQAFIKTHMEFLLPNCIAKSRQVVEKGREARQKLADFIMNWSIQLVFSCGRNGRAALHTACFTGDVYFVQLVMERVRQENEFDESLKNVLCENSGWSPLHYAVVSGSMYVAEALMMGGCDIHKCTDETKTWRVSNGKGITARELAEILRSGKQDNILETDGDTLKEIAQTHFDSSTERNRFIRVLEKTIERLTDVEENGYSPPKDPLPSLKSSSSEKEDETKLTRRTSSMNDDTTKKKKKKKKKEKHQQPENEPSKPAQSNAVPETQDDPTITALLGMGFTSEQISAAAKACGGADRATADDLVMWIFAQESGETEAAAPETTNETADVPDTTQNDKQNDTKEKTDKSKETQAQREQAAAKAEKELREAAKREEESRAAAQRLAAKREEQRRRNREWNNREQARQREEAQAKLTEEMQRRARVEAQRAAMGRMAAQPPQLHTGTNAVPQQVSYAPAAGLPAVSATREHLPAAIPQQQGMGAPTHFLQSNGQIRPLGGYVGGPPPPGNQQPPQSLNQPPPYPIDVRHGEVNNQMASVPPDGVGMDTPMMSNTPPGYPGAFVQQHPTTRSAMHGEAQATASLDGSTFEYPEQADMSRSMIPPEDATVSSAGSGRPPRDSRLAHGSGAAMMAAPGVNMTSSTPPPGFQPSLSTPSPPASNPEFSEEPNPLGEIRATAKAFVPTNFKPTSQPAERVSSAPSPGEFLAPASHITRSSSDVPLVSFGSGEQKGIDSLDPVSSLIGGVGAFSGASSSLRPASSTRLPAALDSSPVPSATSSVAGAPGSSSLLDPVAVATSSSGGGIWGTSAFGFGDATSSLGSAPPARSFGTIENVFGDPNKEDATGGHNWGSGDASGVGGGNSNGLGSIW